MRNGIVRHRSRSVFQVQMQIAGGMAGSVTRHPMRARGNARVLRSFHRGVAGDGFS